MRRRSVIVPQPIFVITCPTKRGLSPIPQTVADIYKSRWEVELFFKWIKQNLKIRSVLGHTINAVATQIFVALCIYLLIAYQKFLSQTGYGLQAVFRLVQLNAFVRKPIADLLCPRKAQPPDPQLDFTLRAA